MQRRDILDWLRETNPDRLAQLWRLADQTRREFVGDEVHLRGLIELSNHCARQCAYCGLRAGNAALARYRMSDEEILDCARQAVAFGYGTVVLQSGEDPALDAERVAELIRRIKSETPLAVTLSLGERREDELARWRAAGADRYLLRFETSNPALFARIHPAANKGERREERGEGTSTTTGPHPNPLPKGEGTEQNSPRPLGEGTKQDSPRPLGEGTKQDSPRPLGEGSGVRAVNDATGPHPNPLPKGEGTEQNSPRPLGEGTKQDSPRPLGEGSKQDSPRPLGEGPGVRAHPRLNLLGVLRCLGYEVGSGVMIGIPGQTFDDLADDIELFARLELDMIGVGPYLRHPNTPLADEHTWPEAPPGRQVPADELTTCKAIALARLVCPRANIPATTALATLNKAQGRELGLARGANVVMPNITPPRYRALYEIYPDKACVVESGEQCHACIAARIEKLGRRLGRGRGDSPNYHYRSHPAKTESHVHP